MIFKKAAVCDAICRKIGIQRKRPGADKFSKKELLAISQALDSLQTQVHHFEHGTISRGDHVKS